MDHRDKSNQCDCAYVSVSFLFIRGAGHVVVPKYFLFRYFMAVKTCIWTIKIRLTCFCVTYPGDTVTYVKWSQWNCDFNALKKLKLKKHNYKGCNMYTKTITSMRTHFYSDIHVKLTEACLISLIRSTLWICSCLLTLTFTCLNSRVYPPVGDRDRYAGVVYLGYHWWWKHRSSQRCWTAGHWSDHHGHWCVDGTELWLPTEPCQRPGTPCVHSYSRMGVWGLQVTILQR